jgi:hypothetical protein
MQIVCGIIVFMNTYDTHIDTTKLESVWNQMKQRCRNPNNEKYYLYGARGIEVLWASWPEFKDWALRAGYQEGLSIDRINGDGNYEPSNCRWVTSKVQANNLRTNVNLTAFGETKTVAEWVADERCTVNYVTLIQRANKRDTWTDEEKVTLPTQANGQFKLKGTKEMCSKGTHDLSENKVINPRGDYYCKQCARDRANENYAKKKAAKNEQA